MSFSICEERESVFVNLIERPFNQSKFSFQELFPANKQSVEHFTKYFTEAGLKELSEYVRNQQTIGARKELQKELQEQMSRGDPFKDVRYFCLNHFYMAEFLAKKILSFEKLQVFHQSELTLGDFVGCKSTDLQFPSQSFPSWFNYA